MAAEQASTRTDESAALARVTGRAVAFSEQSALLMQGTWRGVDLRATGLYGAGALSAITLIGFLVWLEPFKNPQHFLLTMLGCFVTGSLFTAGMFHGRLQDALRTKDDFRDEMNELAKRNQEIERSILKNRLSSAVPSPPDTDGKAARGKPKG